MSENRYKELYEKAVAVCHVENEQKYVLEKQKISLINTIENLINIQITNSECYAISDETGNKIPFEVRMKCLSCGEMDLKTIYIYCPNCGRKFKNEKSIT